MNQRLFERALSAPHLVTVDLAHAMAEALRSALVVEHPELMNFDQLQPTLLQRRAYALFHVARQLQQSLRKYNDAVDSARLEPLNEDRSF